MSKQDQPAYNTKDNPFKSPQEYTRFCLSQDPPIFGDQARKLYILKLKQSDIPEPNIRPKKAKSLTKRLKLYQ